MQNDIAAMAIDATEQLTLVAERLLWLSCSHGCSERLEQPEPTVQIEYSQFQTAVERKSAPLFGRRLERNLQRTGRIHVEGYDPG